jgi:hypothetical protein
MIFWRIEDYHLATIGRFVDAFEELAREAEPFLYPIRHLKPKP